MTPSHFFSIVVPMYNRAWCIERALNSAQHFAEALGERIDVVVVDDGSTDDSSVKALAMMTRSQHMLDLRVISHVQNRGVCAAKNTGALAATGEWCIFLDSDDELLPQAARQLKATLMHVETAALHFFDCIDEHAQFRAVAEHSWAVDLNGLLIHGIGGEKLPVVRTTVFQACPYDEDVRGYESLAYLRMLRTGPAYVHTLQARRYYTLHADRLSSRAGLRRRYGDLARGHVRVLREHFPKLSAVALAKQALRIAKNSLLAVVFA